MLVLERFLVCLYILYKSLGEGKWNRVSRLVSLEFQLGILFLIDLTTDWHIYTKRASCFDFLCTKPCRIMNPLSLRTNDNN